MQATGDIGRERQLSSAQELRAPFRAFALPGVWKRLRIVSDLSPLGAMFAIQRLENGSIKVWRAEGAFRLHAKGHRTSGEVSWTPEILVVGTIDPGEHGTVVDIEIRPPRSWEIGYVLFLYPVCAIVIAFFIATLVFEPLRPSFGWAALTVVMGAVAALWGLMELGPLELLLQTVVGRLQSALKARKLSILTPPDQA
jgi:hypothetical protein